MIGRVVLFWASLAFLVVWFYLAFIGYVIISTGSVRMPWDPVSEPEPLCELVDRHVRATTLMDVMVPGTETTIPMPDQLIMFDVYDCSGTPVMVPVQGRW